MEQWRRNFYGTQLQLFCTIKEFVGIINKFVEDYKKILLKFIHELVLMLIKNLGAVFEQSRNEQTFKLDMMNIAWKIYHVTPSDFTKIKIYDIIKSGVSLPIAFRSWY